ncbi:hypothetical protein BS78_01G407000 [Paspalum vaginatum]|nr:hypothetical protein BS78_01G407000 [Paspalum vaginatum]
MAPGKSSIDRVVPVPSSLLLCFLPRKLRQEISSCSLICAGKSFLLFHVAGRPCKLSRASQGFGCGGRPLIEKCLMSHLACRSMDDAISTSNPMPSPSASRLSLSLTVTDFLTFKIQEGHKRMPPAFLLAQAEC